MVRQLPSIELQLRVSKKAIGLLNGDSVSGERDVNEAGGAFRLDPGFLDERGVESVVQKDEFGSNPDDHVPMLAQTWS
jgi:hypothetical protein